MISKDRLEELETARKTIEKATKEEKQALFASVIASLEEYDNALSEPENNLYPHSIKASQAFSDLALTFYHLSGYKVAWIEEALVAHSNKKVRPQKYTDMEMEVNCFFITHMVKRGASATQAIKLLTRLRGDAAMTEGHLKGLRQVYKDYQALGRPTDRDNDIYQNGWIIADLSTLSIQHLEGTELASQKAVDAFRGFWSDLIEVIKTLQPVIAKQNGGSLDYFGDLIPVLDQECADPLDHIYTHLHATEKPLSVSKRWLREYINDIYGLMDRPQRTS